MLKSDALRPNLTWLGDSWFQPMTDEGAELSNMEAGEASCLQYLFDISQRRDRTAPFEALLSSWWAYHRSTRELPALNHEWAANSRVAAGRHMLRSVHFISAAASKVFVESQKTLVRDLVVPASAIRQIMFEQQLASVDDARTLLKRWYRLALITDDEVVRLRQAGLAHRMPAEWRDGNLLARYNELGISVQEVGECVTIWATASAGLKTDSGPPAGRTTSLARLFGSAASLAVRP